MIDFFTKIYPDAVSKKVKFLDGIRFYSLIRFLVRNTANYILPTYFKLTTKDYYNLFQQSEDQETKQLIVSLTTFPARIGKVHLVIESLLRQTQLPDKIILWLSEEQFSNIDALPQKLLSLRKRGLEIRLCSGDLRSHKKYYYVARKFPEASFIIVDDDVFYPSDLIENLFKYHQKYPNTVCFNRGYRLNVSNNEIKPYSTWSLLNKETHPRNDIMPTGVGGVLYPASILPSETFNMGVFMNHCKYADDIWLYAMVINNGKKLVKTDCSRLFLPVFNKDNQTLTSLNVQGGKNDQQLLSVRTYYKKHNKIDLFSELFKKK